MKQKELNYYESLPYPEQEFRDAWTEWLNYKKERGKPYRTQSGINKCLRFFTKNNLTLSQAIECIDHAIEREWIGLFPLNSYRNGTSSGTAIGNSLIATEQAFANLQRNIDQAMRPTGTADWSY